MAEIKGFKALRFNTQKAGEISSLTCPPYDIISEEQRLNFIKTNPYNVIRLELPREGENPYQTAGETLKAWEDAGILAQDAQDSLYIYEEEFTAYGSKKSVKGFVCRVKLEEFEKGVVLPHEETLSKAKADRFNLMEATNCNFSQIYSLYVDEDKTTRPLIEKLSQCTPDQELTDEGGVIHRLWVVTDPAVIAEIAGGFTSRKLYIADGHHRYETALNFRNHLRQTAAAKEGAASDYVMMLLVDMEHEGLVVFPTHRLVRDLPSFNPEELYAKSAQYFDISEADASQIEPTLEKLYNQNKKAFVLYLGDGKAKLFVLKDIAVLAEKLPKASKALRELDVTVLHSLVLEEALGIDKENMANQINLTYTRVFEEAIAKVDSGEFQCSFILNPTRVTEIGEVAAADEKMPQKSTYFYPKIITGMVMNKLV
ncbi:MAG: DUF1015 domain-containing protein [Oscillospiraceae bacterium]|jgi:uncharacterized protein (DUF1015 family)|nr:DUF1015 domain-containing protein [Oscillospiraceae bacterium]